MYSLPEIFELPFLGSRTYLQGATLFGAVQKYCADGSELTFKISDLIKSNRVEVSAYDQSTQAIANYNATMTWREGGRTRAVGITPLSGSREPVRIAFDEGKIVDRATVERGMARLESSTPYTFISNLVALNKAMLLKSFSPQEPGQWLFTRLELEHIPTIEFPLEVELSANFGFRAVSSNIRIARQYIGRLIFSWLVR